MLNFEAGSEGKREGEEQRADSVGTSYLVVTSHAVSQRPTPTPDASTLHFVLLGEDVPAP